MKKTLGYILLVLSFVAWIVIAFLPFLNLSGAQIAATTTGLIIAGEVLFYASIALLGREIWDKIKRFVFRKE